MEPKKQIAYFQWLRILAAGAVVLMHTAAQGWNTAAVESGEWAVLTLWDSLVRWPVPIFMMITGALFLPRKTPLRRVLTVYIPRMVLVYLLWSAVYALHSGGDFAAKLAAGHYHLWYLPYLCGVYLAMPFLQRIASEEPLADGLLAVSAVIGLLVPWLAELLVLLVPGAGDIVRSVQGHLEFTFFMDCLALVLLGHRLHQRELTAKQRRVLYLLGLLGVFVTGIATVWASRRTGAASALFFDFKAPNNLCTAAAVFVFAKYNLKKLPGAVNLLARCSFGIYLIHPLFIELLADRGFQVLARNPVWTVPVLAAVVFLLSTALSQILAKIPFLGKYLV